jgi:hypothetical protein
VQVRIKARTFGPQRVFGLFNGEKVWQVRTDGGGWFTGTFSLPGKLVEARNLLEFRLPDRRVPDGTGAEGDMRELGLMVGSLEFVAEAPPEAGS